MNRLMRTTACIGVSIAACNTMGHGFRMPDQDAKATSRGEAFAATADNASAIYYNPAGIGMLSGHNVRVGAYSIDLGVDYKSPTGQSSSTENSLTPVPHLFYAYGSEDYPLSVGLGFYAPYGLANEWTEDTGFRSIAIKSEMEYMTINPVIAWRVQTNLSIAAGPTFNYSSIELRNGLTPFPRNDSSRLKGDSTAAGFNLGVLWKPLQKVSVGAAYRSSTEMNYDADTDVNFVVAPPGYPNSMHMDASAKLKFPQNVVVGISYRPTPDWNFEFDVDWTDWNQVKTVKIHQAVPAELPLNWESSLYYEFGMTRRLNENWEVSAGYIFNENSVPDKTFNPWVPDQDRHFVSAGFGYSRNWFKLDFAYQYGFSGTRTVTGSPVSAAGQSADGSYEYSSHAFAVTAGFKF